jgi:hypothetical protein
MWSAVTGNKSDVPDYRSSRALELRHYSHRFAATASVDSPRPAIPPQAPSSPAASSSLSADHDIGRGFVLIYYSKLLDFLITTDLKKKGEELESLNDLLKKLTDQEFIENKSGQKISKAALSRRLGSDERFCHLALLVRDEYDEEFEIWQLLSGVIHAGYAPIHESPQPAHAVTTPETPALASPSTRVATLPGTPRALNTPRRPLGSPSTPIKSPTTLQKQREFLKTIKKPIKEESIPSIISAIKEYMLLVDDFSTRGTADALKDAASYITRAVSGARRTKCKEIDCKKEMAGIFSHLLSEITKKPPGEESKRNIVEFTNILTLANKLLEDDLGGYNELIQSIKVLIWDRIGLEIDGLGLKEGEKGYTETGPFLTQKSPPNSEKKTLELTKIRDATKLRIEALKIHCLGGGERQVSYTEQARLPITPLAMRPLIAPSALVVSSQETDQLSDEEDDSDSSFGGSGSRAASPTSGHTFLSRESLQPQAATATIKFKDGTESVIGGTGAILKYQKYKIISGDDNVRTRKETFKTRELIFGDKYKERRLQELEPSKQFYGEVVESLNEVRDGLERRILRGLEQDHITEKKKKTISHLLLCVTTIHMRIENNQDLEEKMGGMNLKKINFILGKLGVEEVVTQKDLSDIGYGNIPQDLITFSKVANVLMKESTKGKGITLADGKDIGLEIMNNTAIRMFRQVNNISQDPPKYSYIKEAFVEYTSAKSQQAVSPSASPGPPMTTGRPPSRQSRPRS